jgi:mono/diheme cytochrome c family protein
MRAQERFKREFARHFLRNSPPFAKNKGAKGGEPSSTFVGRRGVGDRAAGIVAVMVAAMLVCVAADGSWLKHVPDADRKRVNPLAGQPDALAGGGRIFEDHCAKCHGEDALGRGKRPSLRSDRVQHATDGEIFWLLKNGNLGKGMPTWAALPEPMRWQVIAYVKSLGPVSSTATGETGKSTDEVKP